MLIPEATRKPQGKLYESNENLLPRSCYLIGGYKSRPFLDNNATSAIDFFYLNLSLHNWSFSCLTMASKFFEPYSSSSSSSSESGFIYDVFLSFRGEDTRETFTGHLYTALVQAGIHTFRDDDKLHRGEEISPQLLKAIQESKISLVIFSKGYASSRWCLNELVEILKCRHRKEGQMVIPIFYDIDPSDVRRQTGSFAEAFMRHEQQYLNEKVNGWREALFNAGNLSGWSLKDLARRDESKFIQEIVKDMLRRLDCKYLNVPESVVGIEPQVDDIIRMLSVDTNDVRIVGLHGMGGIGKTTIAKVVYNRLCDGFKGSFLSNVREISEKPNGLVELQKRLLCDILKQDTWKIYDVDRGINIIRELLCRERILVVLDDVDQWKQLEALVGGRRWFGPGSRIIITTRYARLLTQLETDGNYQVNWLDRDTSLQLFSWHAFRNSSPIEGFRDLSNLVLGCCGGLPLALEVLGSSLFKRSEREWRSTIEKLQKIPDNQIQDKLRISFDSLDDRTIEGAFLDIACFFVGWNKEYVAEILDGRGFFADISIETLVERSLVTINHDNQLEMHDLLRDMGREIVREISHGDQGRSNRLWCKEDVLDVLYKQMGTEAVEGLALDVEMSVRTKSLAEMRHLQLLQINCVSLTGSHKHISKELIWLCWHKCPNNFIPSNFQLDKLVVLDMQNSNIKKLWKGTKFLNKLKIINLSNSKSLSKTPKMLSSSLEKLILEGCSSLIEVHQSIGNSKSLILLNLAGCCRLRKLPESLGGLKSLITLNITKCSMLEKLPERLGDMESLSELRAGGTAIRELPSSIGHLKNLRSFYLDGMKSNDSRNLPNTSWLSRTSSWLPPRNSNSKVLLPASFFGLHSLVDLRLRNCGLCEGVISNVDFGSLHSLEKLDLSENRFSNLPSGILRLPKLKQLDVLNCKDIVSISELPSSLSYLAADHCSSLERVSIPSNTRRIIITLRMCQNLKAIEGIERTYRSSFWLRGCSNLSNITKNNIVRAMCKRRRFSIVLHGNHEIPEWFSHRIKGGSIALEGCQNLRESEDMEVVDGDWRIWLKRCSHSAEAKALRICKHVESAHLIYGNEIPEGLCPRGGGCAVSFKVPNPVSDGILRALLVWVIIDGIGNPCYAKIETRKKSNCVPFSERDYHVTMVKGNKTSWINQVVLSGYGNSGVIKAGDELEQSVTVEPGFFIEQCGVHLIMGKNIEKPDDYTEEESQGSVDAATIVPCPRHLSCAGWLTTTLDQSQISQAAIGFP